MNENMARIRAPGKQSLNRRAFVRMAGGSLAAAGALPFLSPSATATGAPTVDSSAETVVKRFYHTLSDQQRKVICLPFHHPSRTKINANWAVTQPEIGGDFYTEEQRQLVDEIFRGVTSPDGYERFLRQMEDDSGGFGNYYVAVFGEPGSGKFEWELTGRHVTIRADGDSVDKMAFGGPIFYGHGASDPRKNVFHYQTLSANRVFAALDAQQAKKALLPQSPPEDQVPIQGPTGQFPGIAVEALSSDQQDLVQSVVRTMLAPYRQEDVDEVLAVLKQGGGLDKLHMAFYKTGDLNDDQIWDIWRIEGPGFVWHFRGAPHVHTYVNVGST